MTRASSGEDNRTSAILDRVVNSAHHIHMDGKSYRPTLRPGAAEKRRP